MTCDCDKATGEGCPECDEAMAWLRDDIDITQCVEILTRSTLDVETGERQFPGTFAHMTIEDCDRVAALLERIKASRASAWSCAALKQGTAGGNDPADCDWPMCGCDAHATEVIEALQESGHLRGNTVSNPQAN